MGSYDYTCAISNLPITAGDEVRYMLLTQNPYEESAGSSACKINDWWFPRTIPLKAFYNDYGSVEGVEEGLARDLWMDGIKLDLIRRGWGNNTCHDMPTSRDMSFEALLEAVQEGRVQVTRNFGDRDLKGFPTPAGVPTLQNITERLKAKKLPLFGGLGVGGYIVNNRSYGMVRVRWSGEGKDWGADAKYLKKITPLFKSFVTMLRAGDSGHKAELLISVKPGTPDFHGSGLKKNRRPLRVAQAMIREDVWQELLEVPASDPAGGKETETVQLYRQQTREFYRDALVYLEQCPTLSDELRPVLMHTADWRNVPASYLFHEVIPFTVDPSTHVRLLLQRKVPYEDVRRVIDAAAELIYIQRVLMETRFMWTPSTSCGPQAGEWGAHQRLLVRMLSVATKNKDMWDEKLKGCE